MSGLFPDTLFETLPIIENGKWRIMITLVSYYRNHGRMEDEYKK